MLFFCAVLLLSAGIQALTGFGFSLLALGILGARMDLRDAVLIIAPAGLVLNTTLFLKLRNEFSLENLIPLLLACLAGVPVGVWLLLNTGPRGLRLMMAVIMITTAMHRVWMLWRRRVDVWHPVKAGIPCGFLSGVLGGAFGAGGPPVVSYLVNRPVNRFRFVATVQVVAAIASGVRVAQFAHAGSYRDVDRWMFLVSFVAVLFGMFIGTSLLRRVSNKGVRMAVIAFLFFGGVYHLSRI